MTQKALPGEVKKGWWEQAKDIGIAIVNPIIYSARRMAETGRINTTTQIKLQNDRLKLQKKQHHENLALQLINGVLNRQAQRENTGRIIAGNERLQQNRQAWEQKKLIFGEMQRVYNLAFQEKERAKDRELQTDLAVLNRKLQQELTESNQQFQRDQNALNRELQRELTEWNLQFQAHQGKLNRQLQRELTALNHEFQAHQGQLNREHVVRLELFRAQVQAWALEQQRELQLELKRLDAELARELREIDRKNALAQLREARRLGNLPINLDSEQILETDLKQPLPLRVFFSPPNPRFEDSANPTHVVKHFTSLEDALSEKALAGGIRKLSQQYAAHGRPIDFIGGAWKDKSARTLTHEAAAKAIFAELKTEPVLILESDLVGFNFELHFAFWGSNWAKPDYQSMTSFSWREMLYDFAKSRALQWQKKMSGKSKEQLLGLYGERRAKEYVHNLNTWGREEQAVAEGIDPQEIGRNYYLQQKDYDELTKFVASYHCLIMGLLADEYFLLHVPREVRQRPLLPKLLSNLQQDALPEAQQEFTAFMVEFYESLCNALDKEESTWMPEIRLDIALSLTELPDKSWAKQQIVNSIHSWMALRGIQPVALPEEGNISLDILIDTMGGGLMTMSDQEYLAKLDECLSALYQ